MTTLQHVGTPIDVPCQAEGCDVHTTVWVDDGEVTGYRPHCQHQQRWTYISEAAHERMAEAGSRDVTPGPGTGSTVEPLEATGSGEPPAEATRAVKQAILEETGYASYARKLTDEQCERIARAVWEAGR